MKRSKSLTRVLPTLLLAAATVWGGASDLDPSFGTGGKLIDPAIFSFRGVDVLPDGRIVVVGGSFDSQLILARYAADGTLDATFGTGGHAIIDLGGIGGDGARLVRQPDRKFVIAGAEYVSPSLDGRLLLAPA